MSVVLFKAVPWEPQGLPPSLLGALRRHGQRSRLSTHNSGLVAKSSVLGFRFCAWTAALFPGPKSFVLPCFSRSRAFPASGQFLS